MNNNLLPIHFAPLQGYTDAVYRLAHARIFGGIDTYYSPFVRVEHGEIRRKDARDISSKNNREGIHLIPQLIAWINTIPTLVNDLVTDRKSVV